MMVVVCATGVWGSRPGLGFGFASLEEDVEEE
jgi:hypothetical protein